VEEEEYIYFSCPLLSNCSKIKKGGGEYRKNAGCIFDDLACIIQKEKSKMGINCYY